MIGPSLSSFWAIASCFVFIIFEYQTHRKRLFLDKYCFGYCVDLFALLVRVSVVVVVRKDHNVVIRNTLNYSAGVTMGDQ